VAEVKALAEDTYGKVPQVVQIAPRARPQEPVQEAPRTVTLADVRVTNPSVQRYYLAPSYTTSKKGESEALDLLVHILGRGSNSRLYQGLVIDKGLAVTAGAGYSGTALDETRLYLSGTPKPGTTLQQLEAAIDAVLAEILQKGVTAEELERAKSRLIAEAVYAQDSQATMARWYGAGLATNATVERISTWPERIRAVSAEEAREVARKWFNKRQSVTGYLVKEMAP